MTRLRRWFKIAQCARPYARHAVSPAPSPSCSWSRAQARHPRRTIRARPSRSSCRSRRRWRRCGGPGDRAAAQRVAGQSVIVENRAAPAARSAPPTSRSRRGRLHAAAGHRQHARDEPDVYAKLGYDPVSDFTPVALITSAPLLFVANNDVPVKSAADLIALAKAKPGELSFGSYGTGSSNHLVAELFNTMAGIETNHVPYRGSAPMMTDLIGGRIHYAFDGSRPRSAIFAATRALLGVSTGKRSPVLPDEPTVSEFRRAGLRRHGLVRHCSRRPARPRPWSSLLNSKVNAALAPPEVGKFPEDRNRAGRRRPGCARRQGAGGAEEMDGDRAREEHPHRAISRNSDHG